MFGFCKGMVLLNEQALLDHLLSEGVLMNLITCMEIDPRLPVSRVYRTHRDFLEQAQFREPVPIKPEIVKWIHWNYRLTYFRDVVMLRYLDDPTMASVNNIIGGNCMRIVTGLLEDEEWLRQFFCELHRLAGFTGQGPASSYISSLKRKVTEQQDELEILEKSFQRKNLFLFLAALCGLSGSLLPPHREEFFSVLNSCGVFRALEDAVSASCGPGLVEEDAWLWPAVSEILSSVLQHDPGLVRAYLNTRVTVPSSLLGGLVEVILHPSTDPGLADQLSRVIHGVINPELKPIEKDAFLDQFYSKHLVKLVAVLSPKNKELGPQQLACDLLAFAISTHPAKSTQLVLNQELGAKLVSLLKAPRPSLVCSAVRLLRACVSLESEAVCSQLCAQKALDQLVDTFCNNGARYNLLNSAILDVFHLIRTQNLRQLVEYLVKSHGARLQGVDYVQTFQELKLRYEQNEGGEGDVKGELSRLLSRREEEERRRIILKQKQRQQKRPHHDLDDEADLWGTQVGKKANKPKQPKARGNNALGANTP